MLMVTIHCFLLQIAEMNDCNSLLFAATYEPFVIFSSDTNFSNGPVREVFIQAHNRVLHKIWRFSIFLVMPLIFKLEFKSSLLVISYILN